MDIANVISNQSTDADIHTHPDSISKDNHVVQQTMKEEELPVTADIGLDGCKSALHAMKKYNFDEDSRGCILTLIKYVDNIVYRWCCYSHF